MRDILKIMRFDFLTAKPYALAPFVILLILCLALSLFLSPLVSAYLTFGAVLFIIPLQKTAEKSRFHKLYGILPVNRKNITRARFLYIFLLHFIAELLEILIAFAAFGLKLNRLLPNQNGEMMKLINNGFSDDSFIPIVTVGVFALFGLIFAYIEMTRQIFGGENEFKIIIITLGIVTALAFGILTLADRGIVPPLKFPRLPATNGGKAILGMIINIAMLGVCLLFGEITASRLAKREL